MVPRERLELSPEDWLLRPACLPIPPSGRKNIFESTVMCLVGSFKFLPPDPQAFQFMMGSHKFSPNKGRCLDWRLSSLTVGMPILLLTLSKMLLVRRGNYSTSSTNFKVSTITHALHPLATNKTLVLPTLVRSTLSYLSSTTASIPFI